MKKLTLIAGFLFTLSLQAKHKHEGPCGENKVKKYVLDSLGLSEDQKSKAQLLFDESCAKLKAIKAQSAEDKVKMKALVTELKKETKSKLSELLTAEQKSKLKSKLKQVHFQNATPEKLANRITIKMTDSLILSSEQIEKVKPVNLEFAQRMKGLREQKASGNKKESHEIRKKIVEEYEAKLKGILTELQFEKFQLKKENLKKEKKRKQKSNN